MKPFRNRCLYCTRTFTYTSPFHSHVARVHPGLLKRLLSIPRTGDRKFADVQGNSRDIRQHAEDERWSNEFIGAPASPIETGPTEDWLPGEDFDAGDWSGKSGRDFPLESGSISNENFPDAGKPINPSGQQQKASDE